jgi:lipopolysaccharide exporter
MTGLLVSAYFRVVNMPLGAMLAAKGRPDINAIVNLKIVPGSALGFVAGAYWRGIVGMNITVAVILEVG